MNSEQVTTLSPQPVRVTITWRIESVRRHLGDSELFRANILVQIDVFMRLYKIGEGIWSEDVYSPLAPRAIWRLELYPNGVTQGSVDDVAVYIRLCGPMV